MLKRKIAYLILLYAVIAFNSMYSSYPGFVTLILIVVLPVAAAVILIIQKLSVRVKVGAQGDTVYRNVEYSVSVTIHNPTPFPITCGSIRLNSAGNKEKTEFGVAAFSKTVIKQKHKEKHCIQTVVEAEKVYIYDYFKLFKLKIKATGVARVTVLPGLFDVEEHSFDISNIEDDESTDSVIKKGDDRSEIYGIREYADGDTVRNIHWKLTSSQNKLMVKEFGRREAAGFQFSITPLKPENEEYMNINDLMLENMYSVIHYFLMQKVVINGVSIAGTSGEYVSINIDSKQALDNYIMGIIASLGVGEIYSAQRTYSALGVSLKKERVHSIIFHFAADVTKADMDALITERRIKDSVVFVPEFYSDRLESYRNMGFNFSYTAVRGGDRS